MPWKFLKFKPRVCEQLPGCINASRQLLLPAQQFNFCREPVNLLRPSALPFLRLSSQALNASFLYRFRNFPAACTWARPAIPPHSLSLRTTFLQTLLNRLASAWPPSCTSTSFSLFLQDAQRASCDFGFGYLLPQAAFLLNLRQAPRHRQCTIPQAHFLKTMAVIYLPLTQVTLQFLHRLALRTFLAFPSHPTPSSSSLTFACPLPNLDCLLGYYQIGERKKKEKKKKMKRMRRTPMELREEVSKLRSRREMCEKEGFGGFYRRSAVAPAKRPSQASARARGKTVPRCLRGCSFRRHQRELMNLTLQDGARRQRFFTILVSLCA